MPKARKASGQPTSEEGSAVTRLINKLQTTKPKAGSDNKPTVDIRDVVKRGDAHLFSDIPYYISTQSAMVDYAIGQPGVPAGRVTTVLGREGSGKSTLVYHLLAEVQRMGGIGVLVDSEQRFTRERAAAIGIDPEELIIIDGATMEQAFASIEQVVDGVRADSLDLPVLVVYDSLAGSITEKRLTSEVGDVLVGSAARLVGAQLPRLKLKISRLGVALVIVNQLRSRINDFSDPRSRGYQERNKVMGARYSMLAEWPLLFESSLMLYVNSTGAIGKQGEAATGLRSRVTVKKDGISPNEGQSAEMEIDFLTGIDRLGSKWDLLEELGYIKHSSAGWYSVRFDLNSEEFQDKKILRKDFESVLADHPELDVTIAEAPRSSWQEAKHEVSDNEDEDPE